MDLLRVYVVVLMSGWFTWLALDKPPVAPSNPAPPVSSPYALPLPERPAPNPLPLPAPAGNWVADFQYATDMVKRGEPRRGFVVLWHRQYWLVSAIVTLLLVAIFPPILGWYRRRGQMARAGAGSPDEKNNQ